MLLCSCLYCDCLGCVLGPGPNYTFYITLLLRRKTEPQWKPNQPPAVWFPSASTSSTQTCAGGVCVSVCVCERVMQWALRKWIFVKEEHIKVHHSKAHTYVRNYKLKKHLSESASTQYLAGLTARSVFPLCVCLYTVFVYKPLLVSYCSREYVWKNDKAWLHVCVCSCGHTHNYTISWVGICWVFPRLSAVSDASLHLLLPLILKPQ